MGKHLHVVSGPPWELQYDKLRALLGSVQREDGRLWGGSLGQAAEELYLDIEGIMRPEHPFDAGVGTLHLGGILSARRALHDLAVPNRGRLLMGIYSNLQGRFRVGGIGPADDMAPNHAFHSLIDPVADFLVASCYNTSAVAGWGNRIAEDLEEATRLITYYDQPHVRNGRPLMAFVWRYSKGGGIVPMPAWKKYTATLLELLSPGDYVCLFGAANQPVLDEPYAEAADWLKELVATYETPAEAAAAPRKASDADDDKRRAGRARPRA